MSFLSINGIGGVGYKILGLKGFSFYLSKNPSKFQFTSSQMFYPAVGSKLVQGSKFVLQNQMEIAR